MDLYEPKKILSLSVEPEHEDAFNKWIQQEEVIPFLKKEIEDDDIIIYASHKHFFIHATFIPDVKLDDPTIEDLLRWNHNPFSTWGISCSHEKIWIDGPLAIAGSELLSNGEQIIFGRFFDGTYPPRNYFELEQKISHVLDIHFIPERNSWCRLDNEGNLEDVVKIIELEESPKGTIITAKKDVLRVYSSINNFSLLRMFDFTRFKSKNFTGWNNKGQPKKFDGHDQIFGELVICDGIGSYSRGIQVTNINISKERIRSNMWGGSESDEPKEYATFIAHDWKNDRTEEISCDPSSLSNYFTKSELPYGTSPAFFNPEVLLKYKSDREKYQLESRSISCRGSWHLKTFDINEAGQVHTYLTYLGDLPYKEQLHWKQYNEKSKAPLSERAVTTDFKGQFYDEYDPLPSLKYKLEELHRSKVSWWTLNDINELKKVHYPYTPSLDEWMDELLNLDQLVVEGLEAGWLRKKAKELKRSPNITIGGIKLTEECLIGLGFDEVYAFELMSPFHDIHNLRSKLKGHRSGREAIEISKGAIRQFGSYHQHFKDLCSRCDSSLEIIIEAFKVL